MKKFSLEKLVGLRHWLHKNAELSLKEFNTQARIKDELLKIGIKKSEIKVKANTGLQVDIKGTGQPAKRSKMICFRADIDALPIKENNEKIGNP